MTPPAVCWPAGGQVRVHGTIGEEECIIVFAEYQGLQVVVLKAAGPTYEVTLPVPAAQSHAVVTLAGLVFPCDRPLENRWIRTELTLFEIETRARCEAREPRLSPPRFGLGEHIRLKTVPSVRVKWALEPMGPGRLTPAHGMAANLELPQSPGTVSVVATADGAPACTLEFPVVAPSGVQFRHIGDAPPWQLGNRRMGMLSYFEMDFVPLDVSFHDADMQLDVPRQPFLWPDGTASFVAPARISLPCDCQNHLTKKYRVEKALEPVERVAGWPNPVFSIPVDVPHQYRNANGEWVTFQTAVYSFLYEVATGRAAVSLEGSNVAAGGWQGPFR